MIDNNLLLRARIAIAEADELLRRKGSAFYIDAVAGDVAVSSAERGYTDQAYDRLEDCEQELVRCNKEEKRNCVDVLARCYENVARAFTRRSSKYWSCYSIRDEYKAEAQKCKQRTKELDSMLK